MSLSGDHAQAMRSTTLSTFRDYLNQRETLACWCPGFRRTAACNVAALVAAGMGDRVVDRSRPRCCVCGSLGQWRNVSQPPTPAGSHGLDGGAPKPRPSNVVPIRPR